MTDNVNPVEVDKFTQLADEWWNINGPLYTLHAINPLRVQWLLDQTELKDKAILDIGCGGGILTESLSQLSAKVTGIDQAADCLEVAKNHAKALTHPPEYLCIRAEDLAEQRLEQYDVITCLECLEHVPQPQSILAAASKMLKPGGHLFLSTLNRTPKAFVQAIVGAEYILKMIPRGTHHYRDFIKPSELVNWCSPLQLSLLSMKGLTYNLGSKQFYLCDDVSVNYLMHLRKG